MLGTRHSPPESPSWACLRSADPHKVPIDPNGNLTSRTEGSDSWTYSWNAENQLTKVEKNGAEIARFAYDPLARRVEKVAGGVTTGYAYDAESILREARGITTLKYVQGPALDEPLAQETAAGELSYFHADALNGICKRTSQAGAVVHEFRYDAWGTVETGASEPGYAFGGREWDPEIGLYYYRARYYSPTIGVFVSEDPADYRDGHSRFAYVGGNPTNWIDPSGLGAEAPRRPSCGSDCPPQVDNAVRNLCANTYKIRDVAIRWCVEKKCREQLPISCTHPACDEGFYGYTEGDGSKIYVCPGNAGWGNTGGSPCLARSIAHEMQHTCRPDPRITDRNQHRMLGRMVRDAVPCF